LFHSFDIVCGIDLDTLPAAWLSSRLKGKKCFYDAHEYFPEVIEVQDRKFVKKIWLKIEQFLVPKVDVVYTVSQSIADTFSKLYNRRVEVIRNLPLYYNIEEGAIEYGILYQGALNEGRGLESLILAMKQIDSKLIIVGDGYLKSKLEKIVLDERLSEKVFFSGFVTPEKLSKVTSKAAIGISFLENKGRSYFFSLSNKFFDYMMAGKPQIGSNFPEYKAINEKAVVAILLDDISPDTIAKNINNLLHNKELYQNIKANCLKIRNEYSWEKEAIKLVEIYKHGE
jgi:glycosyltransferase involved in cell wall biosynthesis